MNVPDPVPEVLERRELRRVVVGCPQDFQVRRDGCEEALRHAGTVADGDRLNRPGHVDEVLFRSLARMIRPRTRVREGMKAWVRRDQPDDLSARPVVEFLEGDLADDLVAEIASSP